MHTPWPLLALIAVWGLLGCSSPKSSPKTIDMPPLGERLQKLDSKYRIEFLEDGYPGKRIHADSIYAHPLYGSYVLNDYFLQLKRAPGSDSVEQALRMVADAAINRMTETDSTLIFWYAASPADFFDKPFYSSLTQSRYLLSLYKVFQATGEQRYKEASQKVLNSLLVPIEQNGVLLRHSNLLTIEEHPKEIPGFILNGWLSALVSIQEYATKSNDSLAWELFYASLQSLPEILPKFDAATYRNSRYHLIGYQCFRLQSAESNPIVKSIHTRIPGLGDYSVPIRSKAERHRYNQYFQEESISETEAGIRSHSKSLEFNVLLNRISYPRVNSLRIEVSGPQRLTLQRLNYAFDVKLGVQETDQWTTDTVILVEPGIQEIEIPISWNKVPLIGYPTTFKKLAGEHFNVYHHLHLTQLRKLNQELQDDTVAAYIEKWEGYTQDWSDMELYQGLRHDAYE